MTRRKDESNPPFVSIVDDDSFNSDLSDVLMQSAAVLECVSSLCGECRAVNLGEDATYGLCVILDSVRDRLNAAEKVWAERWDKIRGWRDETD